MRTYLVLLALVGLALAKPSPQSSDDVSADDVLKTADSAARYGADSGNVDSSLIDELFGNGKKEERKDDDAEYNDDDDPYDPNYVPPKPEQQKVDNQYSECSHEVYRSQGFECVPYYQCDEYGEIIIDGGEGLIDIRGNFGQSQAVQLDPENSKCPGDLEVCCRHPDFTDAVTAPPTKKTTTRPPPPKYQARCGQRNVYGIGARIQNNPQDASTQFGEWPHMCALLSERDGKNLFVCGASLIGADTVLTAAHCIKDYKPEELKIRCGEWDTQQRVEVKRHQDRYASALLKHPAYSSKTLYHDVAVIKTAEPFELDEHIDTICLPDLDSDYSYDFQNCFATGWGKDRFQSGEYQVILKQVEMDLENSNAECQSKLRTTKLGRFFKLHDSFLCAGGQADVDTCKGDGGGPLVCPVYAQGASQPSYVQAGIVAWGVGCGADGIPGVYADVKGAMCFIDWAVGCMSGRQSCPHPRCENWLRDLRRPARRDFREAEDKLDNWSGNKKSGSYKRLEKKVVRLRRLVKQMKDTVDQCQDYSSPYRDAAADYTNDKCFGSSSNGDNYDGDDQDDVDISGYQRTGAKEAETRSANADTPDGDEDEEEEDFAAERAEKEEAAANVERR